MPVSPIEIWTDGSGQATGGPAGCGIVIRHKTPAANWRIEAAYVAPDGTHNTAELTAILVGLRMLWCDWDRQFLCTAPPELRMPLARWENKLSDPLVIYTDSQYALYSTTGRYNGKKNRALVMACREEYRRWKNVKGVHVPGHSDFKNNEVADRLAGTAAEVSTRDRGGVRFIQLDVFLDEELVLGLMNRVNEEIRCSLSQDPTLC